MAIRRRNTRKRSNRPKPQRIYKVICPGCEKEVRLEVPPPTGKTLFCLDCYKK